MRHILVIAALGSLFAAPLWGKNKLVCGTCLDLKSAAAVKAAFVQPGTNWTTGNKRVIVYRLEFAGREAFTASESQARDMMEYAAAVLRTNSYGLISLTS